LRTKTETSKADKDPNYGFNSLGFTSEIERDFIKIDLGPILENAGYGINTTDLMIFDDQRTQIFDWNQIILKDKDSAKYILGTAFHWYENTPENVINLDKTHAIDPTKYILNTEACISDYLEKNASLGSWATFEKYANDIITVYKFLEKFKL
jgi:glucosylceramidase